jgi:hypothetical protein
MRLPIFKGDKRAAFRATAPAWRRASEKGLS